MRVLYFSRDYGPHDHRFLSALAGSGHQVFYLRLERGLRQVEDRPLPQGIEALDWNGGTRPVRLSDGPPLLSGMKRVLEQVNPDVVHAGPIQTCGLLAALAKAHPLLVMSWGFDLMKDAERAPAWRWATRYTLNKADWFTSDCQTTRDRAIHYGMPIERTTVFPWGVDLAHFSPLPRQAAPGKGAGFTLFCNRSWEANYGVDVLAHAFVRVARERQDVRLLLAGGGSQADLIRDILSEAGTVNKVEFCGQVSQADLPGLYRRADLYISPSHVDGTSVSLLEAMACGLPCLVSGIPANREWVQDGLNGWLFPDGDDQALASRVMQAMDVRDSLEQLGRTSRSIAETRADWNENVKALLKIYNQIGRKPQDFVNAQ